MTELGPVFEELLAVLDRLEIPYFVGGSVASGSYGLPRQTNDIDIVADFSQTDLDDFFQSLIGEFYLDRQAVSEAIRQGRSFNAIHLKGAFKFDFFPASTDGFSQSEMLRRRFVVSASPGLTNLEFAIASPEDTVLSKLLWFRKGGEISDRQWHDILGVLSVQLPRLDQEYLQLWASTLHVTDLLNKALQQILPPVQPLSKD